MLQIFLNYIALIIFCIMVGWLLRRLAARRQRSIPPVQPREARTDRRSAHVRPITYERFPRLRENIRQAQVRRGLLTTLNAAPTTLVVLLHHRAIDLYMTQHDVSWNEASLAVSALSVDDAAPTSQGADPLVTALLLQAGCRDDAIVYFRQSTGATPVEAAEAVDFLQNRLEHNDRSFAEGTFTLDLASLHFLIRSGYETLAIRYYRERTNTSLLEAREIVQGMSRQVVSKSNS